MGRVIGICGHEVSTPRTIRCRSCEAAHRSKRYAETFAARFWKRLDRSGGTESCWPWLGYLHPNGYGQVGRSGRVHKTHRVALELTVGPAPTPQSFACHHCDNPRCCNPSHLYWGDAKTNAGDASARGRATTATGRKHRDFIDLTGQRAGRLRVVELIGFKRTGAQWRCVCDCGGEIVTRGTFLNRGLSNSCGCLRGEAVKRSWPRRKAKMFRAKSHAWLSRHRWELATGVRP